MSVPPTTSEGYAKETEDSGSPKARRGHQPKRDSRERVVYIAVANKPSKYPYGRSRIVYIGTTKTGASRIAQSAASKARDLLALHGVTHLEFHVVSCAPRQKVKSWQKLERGLLLTFRQLYGQIPKSNTQGKGVKWRDERKYFTEARLRAIVEKYS